MPLLEEVSFGDQLPNANVYTYDIPIKNLEVSQIHWHLQKQLKLIFPP